MADRHVDDRDLRLVLDMLNGIMEDYDLDFLESEEQAYRRLCEVAGVDPIKPYEFKQQSLGFLEDEPPRPSGRGVMADYLHRWRGGGGLHRHLPPPLPPPPDVAKEIADKMARASKDAVTGQTETPRPEEPKRALTAEEKEAMRRALDGE